MAQKRPVKIPKRLAGVKLSKRTRRDMESFAGLVFRPEAKALAGAFLADIAAHVLTRRKRKGS